VTTSGTIIPCTGSPSVTFGNLPIVGAFNDHVSTLPYVGTVSTSPLTEQMNCVTPVVSTGTLAPGSFSGGPGLIGSSVSGTVNSGTLAVSAGLLAVALVPLSYGVNGDSASTDSVSVVAVIAAIP